MNRIKVRHQSRKIKEAPGIPPPHVKASSPSPDSCCSSRLQPQDLTIMQKSLYCILERFQMYHVQGLCFQKFQLNLSRTALSRAGGVHLISPALGPKSVSGHPLFVTQVPFAVQILSYHPFSPFCVRLDILCKPKFFLLGKTHFLGSVSGFLFFLFLNFYLNFFRPNLNRRLALLSLVPLHKIPILELLKNSFFDSRLSPYRDVTDKGKPFERMGRKTSDLSHGGWVTEVASRVVLAHSFEGKNGFFLLTNSRTTNRRSAMNISRSLIIRHTELDPSYIPLAYRREVLARDQSRCHFCHRATSYLCHDLVKCRGGKTLPDNLLTCCTLCRRQKGELTAAEYREHRQAISLRLEDIFKEMTMRIQVFFADARRPPVTGEVDAPVTPTTRAFYIRRDGNGKRSLIFTEPGMLIDELDVHNIGGKS